MALILRTTREVTVPWVERDDAGNVVAHGVSPLPEPSIIKAERVEAYETLSECKDDNTVIDHAEARADTRKTFSEHWRIHSLKKIYAEKEKQAKAYVSSGAEGALLVSEAQLRGITAAAMAALILAKVEATQMEMDLELARITEKLALPE